MKRARYGDFDEVIFPEEAALLVKVSLDTFRSWLRTGLTPFGEIKENFHYYKSGRDIKIIKDRLCELFGIKVK
jgi:hypothetical protein